MGSTARRYRTTRTRRGGRRLEALALLGLLIDCNPPQVNATEIAGLGPIPSSQISASFKTISQVFNGQSSLPLSASHPVIQLRGGGGRASRRPHRSAASKQQQNDPISPSQSSTDTAIATHPDAHLPTVNAILIPRQVSIARFIRLISAFVLTSSLVFCLATSGTPYENAVMTILGKQFPTSASDISTITGDIQTKIPKLAPLDHFLAKKMAQAQRDILPPRHLPSSTPLLGVLAALLLHVGLTILLPKWVVMFDAMLNYRMYDLNSLKKEEIDLGFVEQYLEDSIGNDGDNTDEFYKSNLLTRGGSAEDDTVTGVAVLVTLPEAERMASRDKRFHIIYWLHYSDDPTQGRRYYFEHSQRRIYFDPKSGTCVDGGPNLHRSSVRQLLDLSQRGLSDEKDLEVARTNFAKYNTFKLPQPTVYLAFTARLSSPLAVLQLLGKMLAILEENFLSSLIGLGTTLGNHFMASRRSIVASTELAAEVRANVEEIGGTKVWVFRKKIGGKKRKVASATSQWLHLSASEVLPGDVFYLPRAGSGESFNMPCDALILDGGCIADEAVLTGESVPQVKRPLDIDDAADEFDMDGNHRGSVLFAGTTVLHCDREIASGDDKMSEGLLANATSVRCLALRTGTYSSEGEITRSLSKSEGHYGQICNADTERDALRLIAALSCFAVLSCLSLFVPSQTSEGVKVKAASPFRRIIQCTRILMASIPSDIPLAISAVAASCTKNLRKEADVVCSEPGSLLTSSRVNLIVFDKTGTLTAETQSLEKVIAPPTGADRGNEQHPMVHAVLVGCHSLETIEAESNDGPRRLVGDPVDLACLDFSRWIYKGGQNKTAYVRDSAQFNRGDGPIRIWQLKSFPFDSTRRCSSALLVVLCASGNFRLLKVMKGAPDRIKARISNEDFFVSWYDDKVLKLSSQGARIISLAIQDLEDDDIISSAIFPKGLPRSLSSKRARDGDISTKALSAIRKAQRVAVTSVHRSEVEDAGLFEFAGLAYFSASLRPSTPRVIKQLQTSDTKICILTGDGVEAAISVANQAGIVGGGKKTIGAKRRRSDRSSAKVAVLDIVKDGMNSKLVWKLIEPASPTKRSKTCPPRVRTASRVTTSQIFDEASRGVRSIASSGDAIDFILSSNAHEVSSFIRNRLSYVSIVARASPSTKESVVRLLKERDTVMMVGDGVNDIGAMKLADVSAALLNGFGSESGSTTDMEDERRLSRLVAKRAKKSKGAVMPDSDSSDATTVRKKQIDAKIQVAFEEFRRTRSLAVLATSIKTIFNEERLRKSALNKGGGEAARILAQEDRLKLSLLGKTKDSNDNDDDDDDDEADLKPGEACLAAACTLLRPCIDGAEAVVRAGVAAAASSLTVHRSIALNSLMACFNLATLYKDGVRYGKYMWNTEFAFLSALDQYCYESACTMRPKLATVRPETSIFSSSGTISIIGQAFIHLAVLYTGAGLGKTLEQTAQEKRSGFRIKWMGSGIANTLQSDDDSGSSGILGRPKFQPNQVTNAVFLLSIFQNTVVSLVNHTGAPFYGKVLENRKLTLSIMASFLFGVACVAETYPRLNSFLQLAPFPSRKVKVVYLALFAIDLLGCFAVERFSTYFLSPERYAALKSSNRPSTSSSEQTAADKEELLLLEDTKENRSLVFSMLMISFALAGKIVRS